MNEHKHIEGDKFQHHEHHHAHDESCSCGDNHAHSHIHCEGNLELTHHEGALIATYQRDIKAQEKYSACKEAMLLVAQTLKMRIKELNGLIGHIKGYILYDGEKLLFSTTGDDLSVSENDTAQLCERRLCLVCIVFNVDESIIREEMAKLEAIFN